MFVTLMFFITIQLPLFVYDGVLESKGCSNKTLHLYVIRFKNKNEVNEYHTNFFRFDKPLSSFYRKVVSFLSQNV